MGSPPRILWITQSAVRILRDSHKRAALWDGPYELRTTSHESRTTGHEPRDSHNGPPLQDGPY
ncbi:hypothetical protein I3300191I4_13750 [Megasphaera elsdenii]